MKRSRFSEQQIVGILKEAEAGVAVNEPCREPAVSCELGNGVSYVNRHGETGLVVPPRDPGALASALNRVLEDATLRIRMGEAGYARAKSEFTLDRMWGDAGGLSHAAE